MRFKMDENLPGSAADLLRSSGHDVEDAVAEGFGGAEDPKLLSVCLKEGRAFITLDKGLGDVRSYRPAEYRGIVVLKARNQRVQSLVALLKRLLSLLDAQQLNGTLWIVDETRVRIRK